MTESPVEEGNNRGASGLPVSSKPVLALTPSKYSTRISPCRDSQRVSAKVLAEKSWMEENARQTSRKGRFLLPLTTAPRNVNALAPRCRVVRRCLLLAAFCALVMMVVTSFQLRDLDQLSYFDLELDDFIPEVSEVLSYDSDRCVGQEWVLEWISQGTLPNCSLANQNKIEILYTYLASLTLLTIAG
jgi:hypothetical protein